jgi:hypothetical protein
MRPTCDFTRPRRDDDQVELLPDPQKFDFRQPGCLRIVPWGLENGAATMQKRLFVYQTKEPDRIRGPLRNLGVVVQDLTLTSHFDRRRLQMMGVE